MINKPDCAVEQEQRRRPWTKDKVHTAVRLTSAEMKMLKSLVRHLRVSQNAVIITALQELHDRHAARKAA